MLDSIPCSVTTIAHPERGKTMLGLAGSHAEMLAERQRLGKPWECPKLKIQLSNAKCIENHARGDYRACQQCSIPAKLPGVKEDKKSMTISAIKKALAEPSWDDFDRPQPTAQQGTICASTHAKSTRLTLSAALCRALKWDGDSTVEARTSVDRREIALRKTDAPYVRGRNYRLCACSRSATHQVNCERLLAQVGAQERTTFAVSITSWGCIVHFARPVGQEG